MIREAGFEAIDWNIDLSWKFSEVKAAEKLEGLCIFEKSQEEIAAHYAEELAAIRENGLEISQAHAPFPCYAPGRPDILEYAISLYQNMIPFLDSVGCKNVIIHGISKSELMDELTPASTEALNMHLYESLIPALKKCKNLTVCLENLFTKHLKLARGYWEGHCSNPNAAADMIDRLNEKAEKKCFGLCLDTGHLNLLRKPFYSYVPIVGERIVALHVHDNLQLEDSHLMPYMGSTRWRDFVPELKAVGYKGDISFETFAQTDRNRLPRELVPTFLRLIAAIGENFREEFEQ
jgi:sugar phosphate isomerase/epimerase